MFKALGEILNSSQDKQKPAPVHRHSQLAGRCEGNFWRKTNRQDVKNIVLAGRRYELATRQPGSRNGALGPIALEILELFANIVDFKNGRLDPSIETIMLKLKRSRDAVSRALKALQSHGFVDWLRRYIPTGNEGRGPQVRQTSNAYRLSLPVRARRLLGRYGQSAPEPEDLGEERRSRTAAIEAYRKSLPLAERPLFDFEDSPIARALSRLGAGLDKERESAKRTESHSSFISMEI